MIEHQDLFESEQTSLISSMKSRHICLEHNSQEVIIDQDEEEN